MPNLKRKEWIVYVHVVSRLDGSDCRSGSRVTPHISAACTGSPQQVPSPTSTRYVCPSNQPLGCILYLISQVQWLIIFMLLLSGPRARGCLPVYSNSGCRGPDRKEGSAHQTTRPFRWCVYQGEISGVDSVSEQMRFYLDVSLLKEPFLLDHYFLLTNICNENQECFL